ncbi:MAG: SUMF1/EgtB/PvdO family nonheme iron enzyme [Saprospiraceae bacterium]
MKHILILLFIGCSFGATFKADKSLAQAENRLALVIGNSKYDTNYQDQLPNAVNDANAMEQKLQELGFEVIKKTNLSLDGFNDAADAFNNRIKQLKRSSKPLVTVFYYSGHGMHIDQISYLLPVDCRAREEVDLRREDKYGAFPLHYLTNRLVKHGNFLNIIMLDACRTNKFPQLLAQARGGPPDDLNGYGSPYKNVKPITPSPMFYAYATEYGEIAKDGTDKNSPYVNGFLKAVQAPNKTLETVFKETGAYVLHKTNQKQRPQTANQGFYKNFIFNLQEEEIITLRTSDPFAAQMIPISSGTFQMGSNVSSDEKPIHSVTVSSFYMSKYEVTQKQWRDVMGTNPSHFKNCDKCPVENVSWDDAQKFIKKLNAQTGKNYRLPTEAEWEYAAKGGQNYKYAGSDNIGNVAWYDKNSYDLGKDHKNYGTNPVGQKSPNGYGLYDMSGNVWEWCEDTWHENYNNAPTNGTAWLTGGDNSRRVLRGGSWFRFDSYSRVALRSWDDPSERYYDLGFRLARGI